MIYKTQHPRLGEITISVSRRSRRIAISVRPPGRVRLSMPPGVPLAEAMAFLESKLPWIEAAKEKMAARAPQQVPIKMPYHTRGHELVLDPRSVERITVKLLPGRIRITYPLALPAVSEQVQAAIKKGIEEAWRAEARELLPGRTAHLAALHGLSYRSVTIRNTRSRWGSCSGGNDLSLSLRLMSLPDELVDYIILHELCHTVHKNHGPKFHKLLSQVTAGAHPELRKKILRYR